MIILDTNVVSEAMRLNPDRNVIAWLDRQAEATVWITSVTVLEVRTGIELLPSGQRQTNLSFDFERFMDTDIQGRVVAFDGEAARLTATVIAIRRRTGRASALCDSMIAGIVIAAGAELATPNTRHFDDLSITLIDPWTV
jgi:predicted nucleic acid-binding protein